MEKHINLNGVIKRPPKEKNIYGLGVRYWNMSLHANGNMCGGDIFRWTHYGLMTSYFVIDLTRIWSINRLWLSGSTQKFKCRPSISGINGNTSHSVSVNHIALKHEYYYDILLTLCVLNISEETNTYNCIWCHSSTLTRGNWNPPLRNTRTYLFYRGNVMGA